MGLRAAFVSESLDYRYIIVIPLWVQCFFKASPPPGFARITGAALGTVISLLVKRMSLLPGHGMSVENDRFQCAESR